MISFDQFLLDGLAGDFVNGTAKDLIITVNDPIFFRKEFILTFDMIGIWQLVITP